MSMRLKAAFVIIAIVIAFTAASFFLSISFTKHYTTDTIEQELSLALDIANTLISAKISLLKSNAETIAARLDVLSEPEMEDMMISQIAEFDEFISLTVYDRAGTVTNYGEPVNHDVFLSEREYMQPAFEGEYLLSSAHYNRINGDFIIHVFVPMGRDRVLSATIPGMFFSDILSGYRLWQSGSIFMVDMEGTFIASYIDDLVLNQRNLIQDSKTDSELVSAGQFFSAMTSSDHGSGRYVFDGLERLCVYEHVTGSRAGWYIGVTAPLSESPLQNLQKGLLFSTLVFIAVGVVISVMISGAVVKPFATIQTQSLQLGEALSEAKRANDAKSNFLANMSHEMRTPLNAIIGLTELILGSEKHHKQCNTHFSNLEKINKAGMLLLSTVNDILDISKIEAGKFELIPVEYGMASLINDIVTQSIMYKGEKPIRLVLDTDENLPSRLCGDELRVKQIFNNLLSNAVKYTMEGTVKLSVGCAPPTPDGVVRMTATVSDTGIGIQPEYLERIFDDYQQTDIHANRKIMGTGLGLSITKRLAELMDGSVTVESEYGKGSVFTVSITQRYAGDSVIGPETAKNLRNFHYYYQKREENAELVRLRLPYARVLIVDDMVTNLDVAKGLMRPYGMKIDCVTSGQQAIDAIRDEKVRYSAVFMDHMMPGMDGIEATHLIRGIGTVYARDIPVIALTANAITGNEEMFINSGFQAFISKPIEISRLDSVIRQWVRDKSHEKLIIESGETMQNSDAGADIAGVIRNIKEIDGLEILEGMERFGGDGATYLSVLRSFTVNTPPVIETLKKVTRDDLADYAITVHGIKGTSRGIYAVKISEMADALEKAAKAGDFYFVSESNPALIDAVERLVTDLDGIIGMMDTENPKPKKGKPGKDVLARLLDACKNYDMDGADAAITELDRYEYTEDRGLAVWLHENAENTNFTEITEKLTDVLGGSANG